MALLTHLLRLCREEHPTLWEHHADPRCRARADELVAPVAAVLPAPGTDRAIPTAAGVRMAAALTSDADVPPVVIAHALAELVDRHFGHCFSEWFRSRSPYQPATGDPIPVDHADLRGITDLPPTAPPWRLAHRLDGTRHVRLAGAWTTQFRVVFDSGAFRALEGIIGADTLVATCHPNRNLAELGLDRHHDRGVFPVQPADLTEQRARIDALLSSATQAGASVVVLPELSVTAALANELEQWVRRPGPIRLLVTGSFHQTDARDPSRRSNRALAWVRGQAEPLTQDKHSPADRPVVEEITPTGWPEIRVHVTADGWHVVIAVCRDLLNPAAVHALAEAGVNLVLAPSMTDTMVPFGGPVGQLVGACQAIVAVANNPNDWGADGRPPGPAPARALFGHPGFPQQTRQVQSADDEPGISLLDVRTGKLRWCATPVSADPRVLSATEDDAPAWARLLRARTSTPSAMPATILLRAAAVLVVLTEGPTGPEVVLTSRAPELTHYPEQVVFPGGAADPADAGMAETALREAREEIGLDPASVHVIGTLPAIGLPGSGFLVTPVLAWSSALRFVHGTNPAEVTSVHHVPVDGWRLHAEPTDGSPTMVVGDMTKAVLDVVAAFLSPERAAATSPS